MASIYTGFDPTLGERFMQEYSGAVILRGRSSVKLSTSPAEEVDPADLEKPMPGEDAQQFHDRLMAERREREALHKATQRMEADGTAT